MRAILIKYITINSCDDEKINDHAAPPNYLYSTECKKFLKNRNNSCDGGTSQPFLKSIQTLKKIYIHFNKCNI